MFFKRILFVYINSIRNIVVSKYKKMQTLKQFLSERNAKMKARYGSLVKEMKQKDAIAIVATEFDLGTESVYTIVCRSNSKNRAN